MDITNFRDFDELAGLTIPYLTAPLVALSGGATYATLYDYWVERKPDCTGSRYFPVDERLVPFDAPQSNWGTAYRRFLSRVGREADKQHFATGADQYRLLLVGHFGNPMPVFDTIFLGVGADGHTASLFPRGDYLNDTTSAVLSTRSPLPPYDRVTLAPATLAAARNLIIIVAGAGKSLVADALRGHVNEFDLPVCRIASTHPQVHVFIEDSARKTSTAI